MTQEEKVRAYDKALSVALETYKTQPMYKDWLEKMFPELAESEDEKIRKTLINGFNKLDKSAVWYNGITNAQILDWLEKQANHANFRNKIQIGDKVTRNRDGVLVNLSQLNRVAKKDEKQGEQKPADKVEPKFKIGDKIIEKAFDECGCGTIIDIKDGKYIFDDGGFICIEEQGLWKLVKQKPAWSEEDKKKISELKTFIAQCNGFNKVNRQKAFNLIDALNPQPKQGKWSEEDKMMLQYVIEHFERQKRNCIEGGGRKKATQEFIDWLKSLKDRVQPKNTWKPSDEQIEALHDAIIYVKDSMFPSKNVLKKLYGQLKKLREA